VAAGAGATGRRGGRGAGGGVTAGGKSVRLFDRSTVRLGLVAALVLGGALAAGPIVEPAETWTLAEWLAMEDEPALALIRYGTAGGSARTLAYADGTPLFFLR